MARRRLISPEAPHDEAVASLSIPARLVWAYLPCHADREGRLEDKPFKLKIAILPLDAVNMDKLLGELAKLELIFRYEVDGSRFIQIRSFNKHQDPHPREAASIIPPCSSGKVSPRRTLVSLGSAKEVASTSVSDPDPVPDPETEIPLKPPKGAGMYSTGFLEFWELYPRKVGKGAAAKAWDKQKPPIAAVKTSLSWQVTSHEWQKDGGQFIPHPATYLNGRRWEDERVDRRQVPRIPSSNGQIAATDKLLKDLRTCDTHKADPTYKRPDPASWCRICTNPQPQVVYSTNPPQPGAPGVVLAALMARSTST